MSTAGSSSAQLDGSAVLKSPVAIGTHVPT